MTTRGFSVAPLRLAGQENSAGGNGTEGGGRSLNILFVGPETEGLVKEAEGGAAAVGKIGRAESFIEAILVAGQGTFYSLIIAGIGEELGHLQRAVHSLRSVAAKARIVLVCLPEDEPMAKRARAWGADDYQILPVTLEKIMAAGAGAAAAVLAGVRPERMVDGKPAPGDGAKIKLAHLPLVVQTSMVDAALQGRTDLAARGVAILQSYLQWAGKLELLTAETAGEDEAIASPVRYQEDIFGRLVLHSKRESDHSASQLDQAAHWLGAWMALGRQNEELKSLAITDELSGAYNRRYFQSFVTGLLEKARVERFRVTLLLFDIDNFKIYNDHFGHAAGDAIIQQLIVLLRRCTREHDLVARIGGDEFAVVFWDSEAPRQPNSEHPRDAVAATERFRKAIEAHNWQEGCKIKGEISISGGIASFPWDADTLEALLATADAALLRAKKQGKNVILLHGDAPQMTG